MEFLRRTIKQLVPKKLLDHVLLWYHYAFAYGSYHWYRKPAQKLCVIGITGTKGKSSTAEMVNAILEEAGYTTALAGTIRFKIGKEEKPNLFKMSMPGRGFLQAFLDRAVKAGCTHAVIEITSEGAKLYRHIGLELNALIFTNIAPEHIEAHGSYENYKRAKLVIGESLVQSPKRPRIMVANKESELGNDFLMLPVEHSLPFSLSTASPYTLGEHHSTFVYKKVTVEGAFHGTFNIENALAALTVTEALGISPKIAARALEKLAPIRGRVERIDDGQLVEVIVDYAHTPDSLKALYTSYDTKRKVCLLGNTGGGRDTWKRPEMARIAEEHCEEIVLTNEDPYDEDPRQIVEQMAEGMKKKKPAIILDRREAIRYALRRGHALGKEGVVLITGKGTDPYLMGPHGTKIPWSDSAVAQEELEVLKKELVR